MQYILLAIRGISTKLALSLGVGLSIAGKPLINWLCESLGLRQAAHARVYSDDAIAQRQATYIQGDYLDWLHEPSTLVWNDYLLSGAILGSAAYVLGRLLIGIVLIRENLIESLSQDPQRLLRVTVLLTALGLPPEAFRSASQLGFLEPPAWGGLVCQAIGAPALGLACASLILLALRSDRGRTVFRPFMAVSQMALTNHLAQGAFIGFPFVWPGPWAEPSGPIVAKNHSARRNRVLRCSAPDQRALAKTLPSRTDRGGVAELDIRTVTNVGCLRRAPANQRGPP